MLDKYEDVMQVIAELGIPTKDQGKQIKLEHCPFCESGLKLKSSQMYKHFSINSETGAYFCHHRNSCGEQGGLYSLRDKLGLTPMGGGRKTYNKPIENPAIKSDVETFYTWYEKERGISADILREYNVGLLNNGKGKNIVYRYFDEEKREFNRKYRSCTDKKIMWTEKGCEQSFYGMDNYSSELTHLIVVEGEDDVHAMAQLGLRAVSVPFGAGAFSPSMKDYCDKFDAVYLLHDNDTAGETGAKRFAEKVGIDKCSRVLLPAKDARQCLLDGFKRNDVIQCIGSGKKYEHDAIGCVSEHDYSEMWNIISGKNDLSGLFTPHAPFNSILRGVRDGELTILTGHTGKGKTTFGDNLLHWIERQGFPVMAFHFENKPISIKTKLLEVREGKPFSKYNEETQRIVPLVSEDEFRQDFEELKHSRWKLFQEKEDSNGYYEVDELVEVVEYAHRYEGVNYFLIDHLHYFLKTSKSDNPTALIDETMRAIRQLSKRLNIHIFLVVHPAKVGQSKDGKPNRVGIESSKGSSSIGQECDNFMVVDIVEDGISSVNILKNREAGRTGEVFFKVDSNYNHFRECYNDNPSTPNEGEVIESKVDMWKS